MPLAQVVAIDAGRTDEVSSDAGIESDRHTEPGRDLRRKGEYVVLQLALPGQPVGNIGIFLFEAASGVWRLRLPEHWDDAIDPDDADYLSALDRDFAGKIAEMGAQRFLESLEESLSHVLRVSEREAVAVDSFTRVADRLFERHVAKLPIAEFQTHVPLYTLRAAAGKFGADEAVESEPEDWVRAPEGIRLHQNMFAAHVVGRSMLPRIPDGSLNLFRGPVVGSRQGKIVLVELLGVHERYTVKRYTSTKQASGEDEWEHATIRLEPLNPEFDPLELQPDQLRVVAEWICTIE